MGLAVEVRAADDPSDALFAKSLIPNLEIEVPAERMKTLRAYEQVWGQKRPERIDVKVTVRDGASVYTNVALHLKGSYTFQPVDGKPSLTLNFDKFAKGQRFHGLDKVHLNNSVQDPSYICEKLTRELFVEAGVPAARIGHARVSLNDRSLGFYVLVEGYNKRFLKRHFESTAGNLYDGGSGSDITKALEVDSGEFREDRSDLAELVAAAREPNGALRFARLEQVLDVDRFLTFAAIEMLIQHWDGYCMGPNNYRLFHDASTGKMVFLPHGMDQVLGTGRSSSGTIMPQWDGLVARALFLTAEGRRRYLERMGEVLTNHFDAGKLTAKMDRLSDSIRASAGFGLIALIRYQAIVSGLKSRIVNRETDVRERLANPERPLRFGKDGIARLNGWSFKGSNRGQINGRRTNTDGVELLEVTSSSSLWVSGSWRKLVLLEAGRYELSAMARASGLDAGATNSGVMLRVSGERDPSGLSMNEDWTPISYEFELAGLISAELVCEFRGQNGTGIFDASSVRLRRLPELAPPKQR